MLDWGGEGPGEEWVNSATHKGERGKAQHSLSPEIKSSGSTSNEPKMMSQYQLWHQLLEKGWSDITDSI